MPKNVRPHLSKKTNGGAVIASDGVVGSRHNSKKATGADGTVIQTPNGWRESLGILSFNDGLIYGDRKNLGWIAYQYDGNILHHEIADSGSKIILIAAACRLNYRYQ